MSNWTLTETQSCSALLHRIIHTGPRNSIWASNFFKKLNGLFCNLRSGCPPQVFVCLQTTLLFNQTRSFWSGQDGLLGPRTRSLNVQSSPETSCPALGVWRDNEHFYFPNLGFIDICRAATHSDLIKTKTKTKTRNKQTKKILFKFTAAKLSKAKR